MPSARPKGTKIKVVNGKRILVYPDGTPVRKPNGTAKPKESVKVSSPPEDSPIPGDDLFYLADAVKMAADSIVETKKEITREFGLFTKEMGKIEAALRAHLTELQKRMPP